MWEFANSHPMATVLIVFIIMAFVYDIVRVCVRSGNDK